MRRTDWKRVSLSGVMPVSYTHLDVYKRQHQHGEISMGQATELCGYKTKSAARKLIERLQADNKIERIDSGPMTRYRIKS